MKTFAFAAFACLLALFSTSVEAVVIPFCSTNADCDDGVYCNGVEVCSTSPNNQYKLCKVFEVRCQDGKICDEAQDRCVRFEGCGSDAHCDDGDFCNGVEKCVPGGPNSQPNGCAPSEVPACMAGQVCSETSRTCRTVCPEGFDNDGDGVNNIACGGTDCDDADATRFPGATEVCNPSSGPPPNHDEDCDPATVGVLDTDSDGHTSAICCNTGSNGVRTCGDDCDDSDPAVNANAQEVCDGIDNDCDFDGQVDEGTEVRLYDDADGDNHGNPQSESSGCAGTPGKATIGNDCDDSNPALQPGAMVCAVCPPGVACQTPFDAVVCGEDGGASGVNCATGEICVVQPNGTGACVLP